MTTATSTVLTAITAALQH